MHEITRQHPDEKTVIYENLIKQSWLGKYGQVEPTRRPISAKLILFMLPPKASKVRLAKMLSNAIRPTTKPDLDNVEKVFADALTGIVFRSDSQIVDSDCHKYFGTMAMAIYEIRILDAEAST